MERERGCGLLLNNIEIFFEVLGLIPDYMEEHSVFSGMIIAAFAWSLWLDRYLYQKRAEAFLGFYSKLSLHLRLLKEMLENNKRLCAKKNTDGNIFALMYKQDVIVNHSINHSEIKKSELDSYKRVAKEIRSVLLGADNNVSPLGVNRNDWLKNQYVILSFCEFIEDDSVHYITNIFDDNNPIHITKCIEFKAAMNYILKSIDKAQRFSL